MFILVNLGGDKKMTTTTTAISSSRSTSRVGQLANARKAYDIKQEQIARQVAEHIRHEQEEHDIQSQIKSLDRKFCENEIPKLLNKTVTTESVEGQQFEIRVGDILEQLIEEGSGQPIPQNDREVITAWDSDRCIHPWQLPLLVKELKEMKDDSAQKVVSLLLQHGLVKAELETGYDRVTRTEHFSDGEGYGYDHEVEKDIPIYKHLNSNSYNCTELKEKGWGKIDYWYITKLGVFSYLKFKQQLDS